MLSITNLSKSFGSIPAVQNIEFAAPPGSIVGILGKNGAGKSTILRLIAGILQPDQGDIRVQNLSVTASPQKAKQHIGYLPESVSLYPQLTVGESLEFFGKMRGLPATTLTERFRAVVKMCSLQNVLGQKNETLSKGFRQRVGLAQALLHDPAVLILDEPTEGLDPAQLVAFRALLQNFRRQKTILFCSHSLSEITELCDTLVFLRHGQISAIGPKLVFADDLRGLEKKFLELTQ